MFQGIGPFSAEERAAAAEQRLVRIAEDPFYSAGAVTVVEKGRTAHILYRGALVGIIGPEDAARLGPGTAADQAQDLVRGIVQSIGRYRARRQPAAARRAAVVGILATLLLAGMIAGIRRVNRAVVGRIEHGAIVVARAPGIVNTMVRSLERQAWRILHVVTIVVLVGLYLLLIFNLFPLTRGFVVSIMAYVVDPVRVLAAAFRDNIGNFIFIAVVVALSRYLVKGLRWLLSETAVGSVALPGVQPEWAMLLYKALRLVVVAVTAVVVYPYIPGSDSEAFKGISLFAGALVTLGASGMAANMIGGLALSFSGTFRAGDRVQIGDIMGDVVESTLLMTRICSIKNEIVTIANSTVMTGQIVNYSAIARTKGLLLTTEVTIGYDAPWRKVHELLVNAALRTREILPNPAPFVLQKSLNDYHVSYLLCAYTANANAMVLTRGELHENIQDAFNEGGVEILSPAFGYLRDGSATTIPATYRPEGYRPEPFKVEVAPPATPDPRSPGGLPTP
ncbi:MAG: mechanosensitive ion channel family protein [Acidobacteria bacterium]|nr:mechanosensitive ion channel family protein [Acidobacteriota bacterium]